MRARPAIAIAVLLIVMPASQALAAKRAQAHRSAPAVVQPATRADVLAGRATEEQQAELLKASIETAGGESLGDEDGQFHQAPSGGYEDPILAQDLDGDGDEEVLLRRWANGRNHIIAADVDGVLWSEKLPKSTSLLGYFLGDLSSLPGSDVLFVMQRWSPNETIIGALGRTGLRWSFKEDAAWFDINGLVQADGDDQSEIAVTVWDEDGRPEIQTFDGETGTQRLALRPTLETTLPQLDLYSQGFVTDGASGGVDEAVFLTSLPSSGAYYAERRSLEDGEQTDSDIIPGSVGSLNQGMDYTGDGRRDAVGDFYFEIRVFDPTTFADAWSQELNGESVGSPPYRAGDANGDGAEDVCLRMFEFDSPPPPPPSEYHYTYRVKCWAGASGTLLWEAARSTIPEPPDGWSWLGVTTNADLNGDGVTDPVFAAGSGHCIEDDEGYGECESLAYEAQAVNGVNGSALWSVDDLNLEELSWSWTGSDFDGVPGDDFLRTDDNSELATFVVRNGLSLEQSWQQTVDPESYLGHVYGGITADVDGDGSEETVVTASVLDRICHTHGCYFNSHFYLAAFEPGGDLLWQADL